MNGKHCHTWATRPAWRTACALGVIATTTDKIAQSSASPGTTDSAIIRAVTRTAGKSAYPAGRARIVTKVSDCIFLNLLPHLNRYYIWTIIKWFIIFSVNIVILIKYFLKFLFTAVCKTGCNPAHGHCGNPGGCE